MTEAGRVTFRFAEDVRQQLALQFRETGWTEAALVGWLDRHGLGEDRADVPQASSLA